MTARTAGHPPIDRRHLTSLLVPIGALIVIGYVGNALGPKLVTEHPLLLMAASPLARWQLLAANSLALWTFLPVATLRLLAADPLFYAVGRTYGDRAVRWAMRTYGITRAIQDLEDSLGSKGAKRVLRALVFLIPNNPVCTLAGAARMPLAEFWVLNIAGTIGRLLLVSVVARSMRDQIADIIGFMTDNQKWFLVASVSIVVITIASQVLRSRGEITGLAHLADEVEDEPEPV